MVGQRILGMMHGHHLFRFQVQSCPNQIIRHQVDILPSLVILPILKNGQVYIRKTIPDPGKMRVVTTVSRQIYLPGRSFKQKRSPQRFIGRKSSSYRIPSTRNARQLPNRKSLSRCDLSTPVRYDNPGDPNDHGK